MKRKEENIQIALADFMRWQYPNVVFRSDFAAGIKMSMGQAIKHKRMQHSRAFPDFQICKPMGKYAGLFLELKKSREGVWLKNGQLSTNQHIQEQSAMLKKLGGEGYKAVFACGIEEAINEVKEYLKN